jgi:hypothetical protein
LERELSALIARSVQLTTEALAVNQRISELYEQVGQRRRNAATGEER